MNWAVEFLDEAVQASLYGLPKDIRARFERIVGIIQAHGLEKPREPCVKHLEGPLWEMRMKGKDGIARARLCPRYRTGSGSACVWKETTKDAAP